MLTQQYFISQEVKLDLICYLSLGLIQKSSIHYKKNTGLSSPAKFKGCLMAHEICNFAKAVAKLDKIWVCKSNNWKLSD